MTTLEELLIAQGSKSNQQYKNLRTFILIATAIVVIAFICLGAAFLNVTDTLNRRSPVLEYMRCRDGAQKEINVASAERNKAQTLWIIDSFEIGSSPNTEQAAANLVLLDTYISSDNHLLSLSKKGYDDCPELPAPGS